MNRWFWVTVLGGATFLLGQPAQAGRIASQRTEVRWSTGVRQDITVPYLTSGHSTILSGNSVAPRIYASPTVDSAGNPQAKPVYNLIFYGSQQGFGDRSNGAKPRRPDH